MRECFVFRFSFYRAVLMRICLCGIILLGIVQAHAYNYQVRNYSVKDGLTQNTVLSLTMDNRNLLWVGTRLGLNYFNGKEFRQVVSDAWPEFNRAVISNVYADEAGQIWCYASNHVYRYHFLTDSLQRMDGTYSSLWVEGNDVYATADNELHKYDKKSGHFVTVAQFKGWGKLRAADKDKLYLVTNRSLVRYDRRTGTCDYVAYPDGEYRKENINLLSQEGRLWVTNYKGKCYVVPEDFTRMIRWEDAELDAWIGNQVSHMAAGGGLIYFTTVYRGVAVYEVAVKKIVARLHNAVGYPSTISHNNIQSIYLDQMNGLWIGSFAGGLDFVNIRDGGVSVYKQILHMPNAVGSAGCFVDMGKAVYAGTEGGLVRIDKQTGEAVYEPLYIPAFEVEGVKCIARFSDHELMLAPYMRGIYLYDVETKRVMQTIDPNGFVDIKHLFRDSEDIVWVATLSGVGRIDFQRKCVVRETGLPDNLMASCLAESPEGNVCVGTRRHGMGVWNRKTGKWSWMNTRSADWIPSDNVTAILWDKTGRLWLGTYGYGVVCHDSVKGELDRYEKKNGLSHDFVVGLGEDNNGSVWCLTLDGVSRISRRKLIKNYDQRSGWDYVEPSLGGLLITSEGEGWIGANNGIYTFSASGMRNNLFVPSLEFCRVTLNGQSEEQEAVNRRIRDKQQKAFRLRIDYDSFPVDIEFNAINYTNSQNNLYKYRIKEISTEWIDLQHKSSLNIAGLEPGDYTLEVLASNNDGIWNEEPLVMAIDVAPPFWRTWWAYAFYYLLLVLALISYVRRVRKKQQREHEVMLERAIQKNQEKLNEEKLQFYTNFSHEMRTPLTLILGPIEELSAKAVDKRQARILSMAKENCKRLMYLVNQLLDFRKMEDGSLTLHYSKRCPAVIVEKVCDSFKSAAERKGVQICFHHASDFMATYDSFLVETVVYNLLSNAFKFTPSGGTIEVRLEQIAYSAVPEHLRGKLSDQHLPDDQLCALTVKDSGRGIPEEELERIFNRFYQLDESGEVVRGSGLGLNFCREIAWLHQGTIFVESHLGEGAMFVFVIPCEVEKDAVAVADEHSEADSMEKEVVHSVEDVSEVGEEKEASAIRVLVVEDNEDIAYFVASGLSDEYRVDCASDGVEAIEKLKQETYQVVITDVMMPRMNGIELCRHIKGNLETSHIPVIILTARNAEEHKLEGYTSHADDYICKPFSLSLLKASIRNVLWKAARYGDWSSKEMAATDITTTQSLDEKFMTRFYQFIDENISNPELSNELISKSLGIGRTQLNTKIKALAMSTPAKLIYKRRLFRAKQMMDRGADFVSDIAYDCGFSDPIYFSRCFKKEYGMTPSEYIKRS